MLQAGCQRRGDRHHRTCDLQLRPPHLNHGTSAGASAPWDRRIDRWVNTAPLWLLRPAL